MLQACCDPKSLKFVDLGEYFFTERQVRTKWTHGIYIYCWYDKLNEIKKEFKTSLFTYRFCEGFVFIFIRVFLNPIADKKTVFCCSRLSLMLCNLCGISLWTIHGLAKAFITQAFKKNLLNLNSSCASHQEGIISRKTSKLRGPFSCITISVHDGQKNLREVCVST